MQFEVKEVLKTKLYIVVSKDYVFKEDWLLQAARLGMKTTLEWLGFIEDRYADVAIHREYYVCPHKKMFEEPGGLKVLFINKKDAQNYCSILNGELK
jgi:hypothetical protein